MLADGGHQPAQGHLTVSGSQVQHVVHRFGDLTAGRHLIPFPGVVLMSSLQEPGGPGGPHEVAGPCLAVPDDAAEGGQGEQSDDSR